MVWLDIDNSITINRDFGILCTIMRDNAPL